MLTSLFMISAASGKPFNKDRIAFLQGKSYDDAIGYLGPVSLINSDGSDSINCIATICFYGVGHISSNQSIQHYIHNIF